MYSFQLAARTKNKTATAAHDEMKRVHNADKASWKSFQTKNEKKRAAMRGKRGRDGDGA